MDREEIIVAPGCYDALTAKMVEAKGFKAVYLGGYAMGASSGVTEPLMTMGEVISHSNYVSQNVNIPVVVDSGAGYGEPIHVQRTVREFERIGAAGIHIEDQVFPKRAHYHAGVSKVIPLQEMVYKIEAAIEARRDPNFIIIARTDARAAIGLEEAISRCNKYAAAGADVVMPFATTAESLEEAKVVAKEVDAPLLYVNSEGKLGRPKLTSRQLEELGYKMVIFNISALAGAISSVDRIYNEIKAEGITHLDVEDMADVRKRIESLIGLPELYDEEKKTEKF